MADPFQPSFPPITPAIEQMVSAMPQMNSMALPSTFHQPYIPAPGQYAVPPPAMHGGPQNLPYGFQDIFQAGRHMQNPGMSGYQQAQGIPFFGGNSPSSMALNGLANMGVQWAAGMIPGGEAIARGMIPWGGLQTSRMDFQMMRNRQDTMDEMFKGPKSLFQMNPELQLLGKMGVASNPFAQQVLGMATGYKARFEAFHGNVGRAFGGSEDERMKSSFQAFSALDMAATLDGGGLDYSLTQGRSRKEMGEDIGAAMRRGAFVTGKDFFDIADDVATGKKKGARDKAGKLVGEVADVMAMGRDVFGQNASADDIISGMENIFGREGVTNAGQASQRLRELEAAGQVLNMDAQTVAKYMQAMKQLTKNAGLIGEAGTMASLGIMMNGENASRFGSERGVNVDKQGIQTDTVTAMQRNMASADATQKEAVVNVLQGSQADVLANIKLGKINGKDMSALQARNEINRGLANDNMSLDERRKFESLLQGVGGALNSSRDPLGRALAGKMAEEMAFPQTEISNIFDEVRGGNTGGYKAWAAKSGLFKNQIDSYDKATDRMEKELLDPKSSIKGAKGLIKKFGSLKDIVSMAREGGFYTAVRSGDNSAAAIALEKQFGAENVDNVSHLLEAHMKKAQRYGRNESWEEIAGNFSAMERADKAGSVLPEFREAEQALKGFSLVAGGMPTGPGQLGARATQALLREINRGKGKLTKDSLANILDETVGGTEKDPEYSDRTSALFDVLDGKVEVEVGPEGKKRKMNFKGLSAEVAAIEKGKGSQREKERMIAELSTDFWTNVGKKKDGDGTWGDRLKPKDAAAEVSPLEKKIQELWASAEKKMDLNTGAITAVVKEVVTQLGVIAGKLKLPE